MIQEFVDRFMEKKPELEATFAEKHPDSYIDIVRSVLRAVRGGGYHEPDSENIHEIDDGDYQGTLLFVIPESEYQPSNYWYVKVSYGSCSGCDTLQAIRSYSYDKPTSEEVGEYMTLALHVVQSLKKMGDDEV